MLYGVVYLLILYLTHILKVLYSISISVNVKNSSVDSLKRAKENLQNLAEKGVEDRIIISHFCVLI